MWGWDVAALLEDNEDFMDDSDDIGLMAALLDEEDDVYEQQKQAAYTGQTQRLQEAKTRNYVFRITTSRGSETFKIAHLTEADVATYTSALWLGQVASGKNLQGEYIALRLTPDVIALEVYPYTGN